MQNYNTTYYQTHKEQIKQRAKLRERKNRSDARKFRTAKQVGSHSSISTPTRYVEAIIFFILVSLITFLLLREMTEFYAADGGGALSWVQAIALEGTVLAFSALTPSSLIQRIAFKTIAIAICAFSIYAMASKQVGVGLGSIEAKQIVSRAISDAEKAIEEKTVQRDYFFRNGWVSAARKTEAAIDALRLKLETLRATAMQSKPIDATTHNTVASVIFRVLLMLANILCAQRLGEICRNFKMPRGISRNETEIPKRCIEISRQEKLQKLKESRGEQIGLWSWVNMIHSKYKIGEWYGIRS